MPFFAAQIWTGEEEKFLSLARGGEIPSSARLIWPRRSLRIRRRGVWRDSLAPIFPSYIFVKTEAVDAVLYRKLRKTPGFVRFLQSNENIVPLGRKDQDLLTHFLEFGEIVDKSIAVFDRNKRIRIVSGPLKGLEGFIVKVDRRKGRAKVKLELYKNSFDVDFGFEVLEAEADDGRASAPPET
jgi:transcriptional antiterminator NusG